MNILRKIKAKFRLKHSIHYNRPRIFILDDDLRRLVWFKKHFSGTHVETASDVNQARELLSINRYDMIFLDHDLLPEHYYSDNADDLRTGYAIAYWLANNPTLQRTSTITVHTRNADGALRMVEEM